MPSMVSQEAPPSMTTTPSKKSNGFFASLTDKEDNSTSPVASKQRKASTKSGDTMSRSASLARKSYTRKFRGKRRSSVTEVDFFEKEAVLVDDDLPTDERAQVVLNDQSVHGGANTRRMLKNLDNTPFRSRPPVRMDAEDGPWSVSVAELAHEPNSYNLYIRTPTHNLTLLRTAHEIADLDGKLRENYPNVKVPAFPIDVRALPSATPTKRKSNFLHTLSRLTSPNGKSNGRQSRSSSVTPKDLLNSPQAEPADPFSEFSANDDTPLDASTSGALPAPSAISTALATYFTSISNTPTLRQARVWKRFVRVRTDDLESVRVERAIKHVRSDLAAHLGLAKGGKGAMRGDGGVKEKENQLASSVPASSTVSSATPSMHEPRSNDSIMEGDETTQGEEDKTEEASLAAQDEAESEVQDVSTPTSATAADSLTRLVDEDGTLPEDEPKTPSGSEAPSPVIHRSKSTEADKSSRLSRNYTTSTFGQDGGVSSQNETGDESSVSTDHKRRAKKKRSMSMDPNRELKKRSQRKVGIDDFDLLRVLGKGCAGKVLLVRHKNSADLYALKAITKRHVLAHQELQHTLTEQAVLKRMAADSKDPFVVKLWWSFHDKENLFLVMDFHPGGDLATQLARWGRLGRDRARFYAAEIVEGVEGLHAAGVIYRDLKPENILIGADGHIVLTDFGLSKEFPRKFSASTAPSTPSGTRASDYHNANQPHTPGHIPPTTPPWMKTDKNGELALGWPGQPLGHNDSTTTFCGTAEYLAPEVIQGQTYSYEIDWWSFGTMLFEMLTGITPFWAQNHSDMYIRVLQDELQFPEDRAIDQDTKSLIRGLLQKNPVLRICEPRIKRHPYFSMIDWSHVYYKRYIPPYIPPIDPANAGDTQNFDDTFLDMQPVLDDPFENEQTDTDQDQEQGTDTDRTTDVDEANTTPSQSRSSSVQPRPNGNIPPDMLEETVDVFDGYSFKGRHSVLIDDEDEDDSGEEETDEDEEPTEEDADVLKNMEVEIDGRGPATASPPSTAAPAPEVDEIADEPKTPEARPKSLPSDDSSVAVEIPEQESQQPEEEVKTPEAHSLTPSEPPAEDATDTVKQRKSKDLVRRPVSEVVDEEASATGKDAPVGKPPVPPKSSKIVSRHRNKREKSGIPALDRTLPDAGDETDVPRDEGDEDWDFIEADGGEDRNGAKGTSLFARGVVDRYKLAVFRKGSTPTQSMAMVADPTQSPQRRGRNPGLKTFRENTRQFLKPKSPPSSFSSKASMTASNSATISAASSTSQFTSLTSRTTTPGSPSLRTKESAASVGNQSSSDQSLGDNSGDVTSPSDAKESPSDEKTKNKKLKKYKENAEKMLSIFQSSPRHPSQPTS